MLVFLVEVNLRFFVESVHFFNELAYFFETLLLAGIDHGVDFVDLVLVPFDFRLIIVATVLEELAAAKHIVVGLDKQVWLNV